MSTQTEITRLTTARNTIRTKLVSMGLATSTDKMDTLAATVNNIDNRGTVTVEVKEGETYTIPKGYHSGSGTVSGVAGGGNYVLQSKTATPTKSQQHITPDTGSYGLSDVTVEAIPENYQDVSSVDATADTVLANKKFVDSEGTLIAGTMPNIGNVTATVDTVNSYTIPKGYHGGSGKVSVVNETKSVTPTESTQNVTPSTGKVLSKVTVGAIPSNYITTSDATIDVSLVEIGGAYRNGTSPEILNGKTAYAQGVEITGTMPNNGKVTKTLDTATTSYTVPLGYHDGTGAVNIVLEQKSATPTKSAQTITPTSGKVLSSVSVSAIPAAYQDVTGVTAVATDVLDGKKIVNSAGTVVTGSMANNGAISKTMDGLTVTSVTVPAGYTSGGTVSLTSDIEQALAAI